MKSFAKMVNETSSWNKCVGNVAVTVKEQLQDKASTVLKDCNDRIVKSDEVKCNGIGMVATIHEEGKIEEGALCLRIG